MKTTTTVGTAVVVLIAGGAWWYFGNNYQPQPAAPVDVNTTVQTPTGTSQTQTTTSTNTTPAPVTTILYGEDGFSPKTTTIPLGTKVEFVDKNTQKDMWVASAMHPTHQVYDNTTKDQHCIAGYVGAKPFDQCSASMSYTFTPDKTGTWKYHNHVSAGDFGTIIVQ